MTDRLIDPASAEALTVGGAFRRGAAALGRWVAELEARNAKSVEEHEARRSEAKAAFEDAMLGFELALDAAVADFEPGVIQEALAAAAPLGPEATAEILRPEVRRISDLVRTLMQEAGFPEDGVDPALERQLAEVRRRSRVRLHAKAFRHLTLPTYYTFWNGLLDFEPVDWRRDGFWEGYVGRRTGRHYFHKPLLAQ